MTFTGTISGVTQTIALLDGAERQILDAAEIGVKRGVLAGQSIVRGNARGRPGPRAITGDFNRSIVGDSERRGSTISGQIGSNAAQALRLEFGFVGPDRLGRVFNQPPYPYMQPSVPQVQIVVISEVQTAIGAIF